MPKYGHIAVSFGHGEAVTVAYRPDSLAEVQVAEVGYSFFVDNSLVFTARIFQYLTAYNPLHFRVEHLTIDINRHYTVVYMHGDGAENCAFGIITGVRTEARRYYEFTVLNTLGRDYYKWDLCESAASAL